MVSKGSSQNMGVFGIVNSHEARLMKPLGKPQKRSYSMPGKTSHPQSPWCLQYLAGDFQQQIWDEWSTPTIVFGMGWSHQPRPQNIPHGTADDCCMIFLLKSMKSADEFSSPWYQVINFFDYLDKLINKVQVCLVVFPHSTPLKSITAQEKYQKPVSRWDATGRDGMIWRPTRYCWEWEFAYETSMNVGTKRVSKNKPPPSTVGGLLNIFKYIYIFRERERDYTYIYICIGYPK